MLADTHFGGLALEFMQVLFKESCISVRQNNHIYTKKRSRESYNTSYYIAREKKKHYCADEKDGRSRLEGKGLKVKLTNLLADLFEDEVI